jgi:hypothetical protein
MDALTPAAIDRARADLIDAHLGLHQAQNIVTAGIERAILRWARDRRYRIRKRAS